nr:DUF3027 domain-containing protein [Stackebrandtia nassauensis]
MSRPARLDRLCAEAVELARAAAEETGEGVGEYLHAEPEAERVVTHFFETTLAGYRGWRWAVVVARAPRSRTVTVNETALLPGPDALKSPEWVPWAERLRAGDVGVGDLLPTDESDARLTPAYTYSDDDAVEDIAFELGVGRARVMSREGRIDCAERWYEGDHGPSAEISVSAPPEARCGSCGFYLPLAGSLRQVFGVCGNMYASDDATVVSSDHGCGAHSEVLTQIDATGPRDVELTDTAYDDALIEQVDTTADDEEPEAPVAEVEEADEADEADATAEVEAETETAEVEVEVTETAEAEPETTVTEPAPEPTAVEVAEAPADTPETTEIDAVEAPAVEAPQPVETEPVAEAQPAAEPVAEAEPEVAVVEPMTEADQVADTPEGGVTEPIAEPLAVTEVAAPADVETPAEAEVTEAEQPQATQDDSGKDEEPNDASPAGDVSGSDREAP